MCATSVLSHATYTEQRINNSIINMAIYSVILLEHELLCHAVRKKTSANLQSSPQKDPMLFV